MFTRPKIASGRRFASQVKRTFRDFQRLADCLPAPKFKLPAFGSAIAHIISTHFLYSTSPFGLNIGQKFAYRSFTVPASHLTLVGTYCGNGA
jgi:hypothetical protein